jgi:phospholipid/cholesterol/gamma-HCH transport system substrate-binding protein
MSGRVLRRGAALVALAAVGVAGAALYTGGDDGYVLYAQFSQAGGLREGFKVRVDGASVGKIDKLELDSQDRVVAKLRIDESAAPVGRDVRATSRAADLLGEKFIDLEPGDRQHAAPSGTVIPTARTALAVELDDVVNALDLPTRQALRVFINEQGAAFVGRGRDLRALLAALPPSLDRTGTLLAEFARDNQALGRLVDQSDRVVGSVARERASLGRFVAAAGGTFDTLGRRSRELGATVRKAPATLVSARRALVALEGAAVPLGPAARGLRATAPQLTATLNELPAFAAAARPTLRTVRQVTPTLQRLGRRGTPVVRRLRPLTGELDRFAAEFDPVTQTLDKGIGDVLGVLEGWARSTQARDTASHVFRFGATAGPQTFSSLAAALPKSRPTKRERSHRAAPRPSAAPRPTVPDVKTPAFRTPELPKVKVPQVLPKLPADVLRELPRLRDELPDKIGVGQQPEIRRRAADLLLDYLLGA